MRGQRVDADLSAVVRIRQFFVFVKGGSWNLEDMELHVLLNTLVLELLVQ